MPNPVITTDISNPAVAVISMNRPEKRNALSLQLITELTQAFADSSRDRSRRAVILRGEGKGFCAGLDLDEMSQAGNAEMAATALAELYEVMATSPVVTIAAAHGAAFGGGVGLIAASDIVIATDDLKIGFPEVKRGLTAALITTLLRRTVPDRALRELIVLGLTIDAKQAQSLQMVNRIVGVDQLMPTANDYAKQVIAAAPNAVARTKKLLDDIHVRGVRDDLQMALKFHFEFRHEGELKEGVAAFHEKREPRWGLGGL